MTAPVFGSPDVVAASPLPNGSPAYGLGWPDRGGLPGMALGWPVRNDVVTAVVSRSDGMRDEPTVSRETTRAAAGALTTEPEGGGSGQTARPLNSDRTSTSGSDVRASVSRETISAVEVTRPSSQSSGSKGHRAPTAWPRPERTRVLTIANQKGGVGKTTTCVNVAAAMALQGLQVLVIDIDPQGNASTALGIDHHADVPNVYDVLIAGAPLASVVQPCASLPNLRCAPATIDLAGAELELVSLVARETRLHRALTTYLRAVEQDDSAPPIDYVLIDCPPSLGLLTVNAFVAAAELFIPIQCEYYALEGLSQLLKNVELIRSHLNPDLHVSTILLTMYDGRTRLSAQVADDVRSHFPAEVLRTTVPRSVRISEAPSHGETVITYDPGSSGALSYVEAAAEIAQRGSGGAGHRAPEHKASSSSPRGSHRYEGRPERLGASA